MIRSLLALLLLTSSCFFLQGNGTEYLGGDITPGGGGGGGGAGSAEVLQGAPSATSLIRLRNGQVDAITGDLSLTLRLGPTLPGRIPVGFSWTFGQSTGSAEHGPAFYPVSWPSPEVSNPQITMWFNGQCLRFLKNAAPSAGLPSVVTVVGWLSQRHAGNAVLAQLSAGARVYGSSDGQRFLIVSTAAPTAMAVLDGDEAITMILQDEAAMKSLRQKAFYVDGYHRTSTDVAFQRLLCGEPLEGTW